MIKKTLFLFLIINYCNLTWSQENKTSLDKTNNEEKVIITITEEDPIFPGCEDVERKERKKCLSQKINEHIQKNFNYPKEAKKNKITGRVVVSFIIDKEGYVKSITTRGPENGKLLEEEARRIISLLPKMKPGTQKGEPVNVQYSIPLNFNL